MHPLLSSRMRVGLYLAACFSLVPLMAFVLRLMGPRPWFEAVVFAGPLTLFYASVCLSAWWICRSVLVALATSSKPR